MKLRKIDRNLVASGVERKPWHLDKNAKTGQNLVKLCIIMFLLSLLNFQLLGLNF